MTRIEVDVMVCKNSPQTESPSEVKLPEAIPLESVARNPRPVSFPCFFGGGQIFVRDVKDDDGLHRILLNCTLCGARNYTQR